MRKNMFFVLTSFNSEVKERPSASLPPPLSVFLFGRPPPGGYGQLPLPSSCTGLWFSFFFCSSALQELLHQHARFAHSRLRLSHHQAAVMPWRRRSSSLLRSGLYQGRCLCACTKTNASIIIIAGRRRYPPGHFFTVVVLAASRLQLLHLFHAILHFDFHAVLRLTRVLHLVQHFSAGKGGRATVLARACSRPHRALKMQALFLLPEHAARARKTNHRRAGPLLSLLLLLLSCRHDATWRWQSHKRRVLEAALLHAARERKANRRTGRRRSARPRWCLRIEIYLFGWTCGGDPPRRIISGIGSAAKRHRLFSTARSSRPALKMS
mmetsp:Transcript_7593/g.18321  ORF Transcript_7593/g.18321 Transcript_7593/m.18321 type:complete len:324 (+) Transcript_7593:176-1147(+)